MGMIEIDRLTFKEQQELEEQAARWRAQQTKMAYNALNVIAGSSSSEEIRKTVSDIASFDTSFIRGILFYGWSAKVPPSLVFPENIEALSTKATYIRNALITIVEAGRFSFQQNKITKTQLQSWLGLFPAFMFFPKKTLGKKYSFIEKLMEFCDKLPAEELSQNEALCLQRIIDDYKPKHVGYEKPPEDLYQLLTQKLQKTETLEQLRQQKIQNSQTKISFKQYMQQYIFTEGLPYLFIMSPEAIGQIFYAQDTKPLQTFITKRHIGATCVSDPIYAPDGIVTELGIKKFFDQIFDWPAVLQEWMPNYKLEVTAGTIPSDRTTTQDKQYWLSIINDLFIQMSTNRSLIFDAVRQRVSFHGKMPQNLEQLIEVLSAIERGENVEFTVDPRVMFGFNRTLLVSPEMSLSYHLIFEAISSVIAKELVSRTSLALEKELLSSYSENDDRIGLNTAAFSREINNTVEATVREAIQNTLPYKLRNLPIADFMMFIDVTYEQQINLTVSGSMESDLFKQESNLPTEIIHEILFTQTASTLQQSTHHDRVNYYLTADLTLANQPENVPYSIETFSVILQKSFVTEKELLLLILAMDETHQLNQHLFSPLLDMEKRVLAQKIIEKFDILCHFNVLQDTAFNASPVGYRREIHPIPVMIQRIFTYIHKSPILFSLYCHRLLSKRSVDNMQLTFLVKYFKEIKLLIQEPELLEKLATFCRPVWNTQTIALEKKINSSNCFSLFEPRRLPINQDTNRLSHDFQYFKTQCCNILNQDSPLKVTRSLLPNLFFNDKKQLLQSAYADLVSAVKTASSIEDIHEQLAQFRERLNKTISIPQKITALLDQCMLLIAQKNPELVQWESIMLS